MEKTDGLHKFPMSGGTGNDPLNSRKLGLKYHLTGHGNNTTGVLQANITSEDIIMLRQWHNYIGRNS